MACTDVFTDLETTQSRSPWDVTLHPGAVSSSNNGATTSAGAVESNLLDANLLSLLEAVQAGRLQPEAAALQLRERSAGYQQVVLAATFS